MFTKIENIVKALNIELVSFRIRRPEILENEEKFREIHLKYNVDYKVSRGFSTSYGKLPLQKFISFLKEYHQLLDLSTVLIDLESVVINPLFL